MVDTGNDEGWIGEREKVVEELLKLDRSNAIFFVQ